MQFAGSPSADAFRPDHRAGARIDTGVCKFLQKIIRFRHCPYGFHVNVLQPALLLTCHLASRIASTVRRHSSDSPELLPSVPSVDFKHFPAKFHDTFGKRSYKSLCRCRSCSPLIPVTSAILQILRMFLRNGIFFRKAQWICPRRWVAVPSGFPALAVFSKVEQISITAICPRCVQNGRRCFVKIFACSGICHPFFFSSIVDASPS